MSHHLHLHLHLHHHLHLHLHRSAVGAHMIRANIHPDLMRHEEWVAYYRALHRCLSSAYIVTRRADNRIVGCADTEYEAEKIACQAGGKRRFSVDKNPFYVLEV